MVGNTTCRLTLVLWPGAVSTGKSKRSFESCVSNRQRADSKYYKQWTYLKHTLDPRGRMFWTSPIETKWTVRCGSNGARTTQNIPMGKQKNDAALLEPFRFTNINPQTSEPVCLVSVGHSLSAEDTNVSITIYSWSYFKLQVAQR